MTKTIIGKGKKYALNGKRYSPRSPKLERLCRRDVKVGLAANIHDSRRQLRTFGATYYAELVESFAKFGESQSVSEVR